MGSKQDLLLHIMRAAMHDLIANARAALQQAAEPHDQLAALARTHIFYNGRNQLDALVGDGEIRSLDPANRARIVSLRDTYEDLWADVIKRGVDSGQFQINDQKLFRLAVIQMCNGVSYWYRPAGGIALSAIADEFGALVLSMAGYRGQDGAAGRQMDSEPLPNEEVK